MRANKNDTGVGGDQEACSEQTCCEGATRREFLKLAGLGALALASGLPVMAGPFEASDFEKLIPADKKLSPEWIKSLFARGNRTVYRGSELEKIGMPVGGICAGQLYLGGDGKLWHWDLFNRTGGTGAEHYASSLQPSSPLDQGFALRLSHAGKTQIRALDRTGFSKVKFCGEYPIGFVEYRDEASPLAVSLEAFSPFIPLNPDDSNLPATILQFTLKNNGKTRVEAELAGWLENAVCLHSANQAWGARHNRVLRRKGMTFLEGSAAETPPPASERPLIVFEDFEGENYGNWKVEGDAFGKGPAKGAPNPGQHLNGFLGRSLVNTWLSSDEPRGKLTSPRFTIERSFISFLIGGGNHPGETCINLIVDGAVVRTQTGSNTDAMTWANWDVRELMGKTACIEIVDNHSGGWGHIDIDQIEFRDRPRETVAQLTDQPDFGTMGLALLGSNPRDKATASIVEGRRPGSRFPDAGSNPESAEKPFGQKLCGSLSRKLSLAPAQEAKVTFVVTWHFPNLRLSRLVDIGGQHYANRFRSATAVAEHVAGNFKPLSDQTRLWHDTWYDSTLPYWFLDRTFANTSILATATCHWLSSGRFYATEGVGCCEGTCTHVWHYAQAVARLFPQLERDTRERVDYGIAFDPESGVIDHRGEFHAGPAIDGQAGCILRAYREHQMSADDAFLKRNWLKIKRSLEYLISQDGDGDGILEGAQPNTLDSSWYGPVAWLSSLYLAALRAGEEMARELGDESFVKQSRRILDHGSRRIVEGLWNGEYFVHKPDPKHPEAIGSAAGCEIDQVFGQSWAFQVGLGRILPEKQVRTALRSLWRYNFTPDVGAYRKANEGGRWYAMPGEAGLIMCTFPKGGRTELKGQPNAWTDMYFNECMTGFEYQVAGHMIWEDMVVEGMALCRAIHDRYHASRRNPWNEVECGDHYGRAMASYGAYIAACGYKYHGPKGYLAFAPRLTPEDFRAAFTTAEGWGTFAQKREGATQRSTVALRWGRLRLRSLFLGIPERAGVGRVKVTVGGKPVPATCDVNRDRLQITLDQDLFLHAGQSLEVSIN